MRCRGLGGLVRCGARCRFKTTFVDTASRCCLNIRSISTTDFVDIASRRCFNGRILLTQIKRWETQRDQILIKEGIENVSIPRQEKKAKFIVGEKNIEITGNSRHGGSSAGDQMEQKILSDTAHSHTSSKQELQVPRMQKYSARYRIRDPLFIFIE